MSYNAHPEGSPLKQRHTRDAAGCMDGNAQRRPVAGSAKHSCLAANISRTMTDGWHPATRTRLRSSGRKVLGRIPAAEDADAIVYDSASNRIFTFNGDAHSSTAIDPRAGTNTARPPATARCTQISPTRARWLRSTRRQRPWRGSGPPTVQAAGLDSHRHRPPSAVQRIPRRRDGDLRLSNRQGSRNGPDSGPALTAPGSMQPQATRLPQMRTARSP